MRLQLCTWPEIEAYLDTSTGIIIPIGSTEQHGPTGFIGTDALCPEIISQGISEVSGALIAPTINVGMAQHHIGFPGSITLRPSTLITVIVDTVKSLEKHGFNRFFFLNGHGGNIATISAAFSEIYAERSLNRENSNCQSVRCHLQNWWSCNSVIELSKKLFGDSDGSHATASEISLTYFGYPEEAKRIQVKRKLNPEIAPKGPIYDAKDYRKRFPDGRIGSDPTLASIEAGQQLYQASVSDLAKIYQDFIMTD